MILPALVLLLQVALGQTSDGAFVVYRYGDQPELRDALVAHGEMFDDLGGYVLGRPLGEPAERFEVTSEGLTALEADETLAVLVRHEHGETHPGGRLLWEAPEGHVSLIALDTAELKAGLRAGFRCHGAFRPVRTDQPMKPVRLGAPLRGGGNPNPLVQGWVAQVSQQNLEDDVDAMVAFGTRRHFESGEVAAQNWLLGELAALGLNASLFDYDSGADVVVGELPGLKDPSKIVIIGGHYDSINFAGAGAPAPGADDDASGVAAVLEIARILSQEKFDHTIRFCAWSGEEFGLLGSEAYASHLDNIDADIVGMVQLDMIAYRASGDTRSVDFVTNDTNPALNAFAESCFQTYVPSLPTKSGFLSGGTSDHRSFHNHGFPATFPFEDLGQYSPFIHTGNDTVGTSANDFILATLITQGALATVAELGRPLSMELTHTALPDTQDENGPYVVDVTAVPLNGQSVTGADLLYRVDGGSWQTVAMSPTANPDEWSGDIPGQASPAVVEYYVVASDSLGNQAWLPDGLQAGDTSYRFVVGIVQVVFFDDFEVDQGWTHQQVQTQDDWQRDTPQGKAGDPNGAFSGSFAWANDVGRPGWNGEYAANVSNWLESPSIDCSNSTDTRLRMRRWLTVESGQYDQARIQVNGTTVWENPFASDLIDGSWVDFEVDISAIADNNPSVRIRFTMESDSGVEFGGWTLDDVEVYSLGPVGGNKDTILLTGDTTGAVGSTVSYSFSNAPASSLYRILYSFNLNGSILLGHPFDVGAPVVTAVQGTADPAGAGSWTSAPLPAAATGRTVYIEVGAQDSQGDVFDSNVVTLVIS